MVLALILGVSRAPPPDDFLPPATVSMVFNGGRPEGPRSPNPDRQPGASTAPPTEGGAPPGEARPPEAPPPAETPPPEETSPPKETAPPKETSPGPETPPSKETPPPEAPLTPAAPSEPAGLPQPLPSPAIVSPPPKPGLPEPGLPEPGLPEPGLPEPGQGEPAVPAVPVLPPPGGSPTPPAAPRAPPVQRRESWPPLRPPVPPPRPSDFPPPINYSLRPPPSEPGVLNPGKRVLSLGMAPRGAEDSTPFSLDTDAEVGPDWRNALTEWVNEHAYYPSQAAALNQQGNARVLVTATPDGRVQSVEMEKRSGSPWLDLALQGLFRGAKLPAMPKSAGDQPVSFHFTMHYILIH